MPGGILVYLGLVLVFGGLLWFVRSRGAGDVAPTVRGAPPPARPPPAGGPAPSRASAEEDEYLRTDDWLNPEKVWLARVLDALPDEHLVDPELIGQGGMGVVFRLRDVRRGSTVALKILDPSAHEDPGTSKRFLRGAHALEVLDHPALPRILRFAPEPIPWLLRTYVEGQNLHRVVDERGPRDSDTVRGWLRQAADALAHAHARKVVHRDIKPANLLLDAAGRVHVIDFDLALMDTQTRITKSGAGAGTLQFVPPEQLQGEDPTPRSDVYALAVTGFWLVSMTYPYPFEVVASGSLPSLRPLPEGVDPQLVAGLRAALAIDPMARPADMRAFMVALGAE